MWLCRVILLSLFISPVLAFQAISSLESAWPYEFTSQGQTVQFNFEIPVIEGSQDYLLVIDAVNVNNYEAVQLQINSAVIDTPPELFDVYGKWRGNVWVTSYLQAGTNQLMVTFANNRGGDDPGFSINSVQIWGGAKAAVIQEYDQRYQQLYGRRLVYRELEPTFEQSYDFEDIINMSESNWQVIEGSALIVQESQNQFLRLNAFADLCTVKLNCFSRDTVLKGRFRVLYKALQGNFQLALRHNMEDDHVYKVAAEYDSSNNGWGLYDCWLRPKEKITAALPLSTNQWYTFEVVTDRMTARLYIDDVLVCKTSSLKNTNYGGLALYADHAIVDFDDLEYTGDDNPVSGHRANYFPSSAMGDMLKLANSDLILHVGFSSDEFMVSHDNGLTWQPTSIFSSLGDDTNNILRLGSGRLLAKIEDTQNNLKRYGVRVSDNTGATWSNVYWVTDGYDENTTINSKMSQASNGRIFLPASSEYGETDGGAVVFYSDDDGLTWNSSNILDRTTTGGYNVQEAQVVELTNGQVRLLVRTDLDKLAYFDSTDNGTTWNTTIHIMPIMSPMNAFNVRRNYLTDEIFLFWTYETQRAFWHPALPRERLALAKTSDNMQSWQYLMTVDDFQGLPWRFNDLGMYLDADGGYIYPMVNLMVGDRWKRPKDLMMYRVPLSELTPFNEFPPLRNNRLKKNVLQYDFEEFSNQELLPVIAHQVTDKKGDCMDGTAEYQFATVPGSQTYSGNTAVRFTGNNYGIRLSDDDILWGTERMERLNLLPGEDFLVRVVFNTSAHTDGGAGGSGAIVSRDVGTGYASWWIRVQDGLLRFFVQDNVFGTMDLWSQTNVSDGNWHEAVFVRDIDAGQFQIYLDGSLNASVSDTISGLVNPTSDLVIGCFNDGSRSFIGDIDKVQIYRGKMSGQVFLRDGDLNSDGRIDLEDLMIIFGNWLTIIDN